MDAEGARNYILERLQNELESTLYYHSYQHTLDVIKSVEEQCQTLGIKDKDRELVTTAAAFHDSGYLEQYNDNEEIACSYARQTLPGFDFKEEDIETVCRIIMTTRHNVEPRNILEEIMCDADHDYLGRKDYKRVASSLYKELAEHGYSYNEREWITMQINFLSNKHQYYTQWAKENREPTKKRHLERLREQLI